MSHNTIKIRHSWVERGYACWCVVCSAFNGGQLTRQQKFASQASAQRLADRVNKRGEIRVIYWDGKRGE